jgi:exonuclease VII small subunit
MRDRTPKARETEPTIPAPSPTDEKLAQLHALAEKIERHRSELDDYLNDYAKLISPPGVPTVNIRMMIDARGMCICQSALFAISERVEALLLERKQALEEEGLPHHA